MIRRFAVAALAFAALAAASSVHAQQASPRDLWPQATTSARENDLDMATKRVAELIATGRTYGITSYPQYAASAAGLASHAEKHNNADLLKWASSTAGPLDSRSPAVAFSEADRAARKAAWGEAVPLVMRGFTRVMGDYRSSLLSRADLLIVAGLAIVLTAVLLSIALLIRYGRAMAHDFREMLSSRLTGGSVSVLAFALLFLPLFFWLGPMWLLFYWLAIFFPYGGNAERVAIVVLLILVALLPIAGDYTAARVAGIESPVMLAAISGDAQAYQPEALRRLQELISAVPDHPMLHLLAGNMQGFEGNEEQAQQHYNRAVELRPNYAGAHVNLGNLLYLNSEFQAAMTEYEKAQRADPKLAAAFFNHSVASGETYKFDQQTQMLERARKADPSFVERVTRTAPPQKIVMYSPSIKEAWVATFEIAKIPAARSLFGNYAIFDVTRSAANPLTIGALSSLLLAMLLWMKRRRTGLANACIKCGRTFCPRCKSARESTTYCTQCIHIYLKRDGVSIDTKRKKLEEVTSHQTGMVRRNKLFATFLPGAAQILEGRAISGIIGVFLFGLFLAIALLVGRLAPALGPSADFAQLLVRVIAIAVAVILWFVLALPVYRRRSVA
ncbi:MAG TPA: tetratricopeptide repeat protein [Thermoanaerobaculia bacterium]|jgi:tetratricopeptide (TPR) repeat protein|nr:tetratricopeptide repeat protein [Thermoanaerobaculia bacterium]